jgi:hypothetical protein
MVQEIEEPYHESMRDADWMLEAIFEENNDKRESQPDLGGDLGGDLAPPSTLLNGADAQPLTESTKSGVNPNTGLLTPEASPDPDEEAGSSGTTQDQTVQEGFVGQRMSPQAQEVRVPTSSNFRIVIPQYDPKHAKHPATSGHYQQRDDYAETTPLERQESGRYGDEADSADDDTGSETEERSTAVPITETRRKIKRRVYQKTRKSNR